MAIKGKNLKLGHDVMLLFLGIIFSHILLNALHVYKNMSKLCLDKCDFWKV